MSISGSGEVILVGNGVTSGRITFDGDMTVALVNVNIEAYNGTPITVGGGKVTFELFGENRLVAKTTGYSALYNAEGTTVTLRGAGTLVAKGGEFGAGIGSGYQGTCGDITISGGVVVAEGGNGSAGIGSGYYYSRCGEILISGGKVTATGGMEAAGIGCGALLLNLREYHDFRGRGEGRDGGRGERGRGYREWLWGRGSVGHAFELRDSRSGG